MTADIPATIRAIASRIEPVYPSNAGELRGVAGRVASERDALEQLAWSPTLPSCGVAARDYEGCFVHELLARLRALLAEHPATEPADAPRIEDVLDAHILLQRTPLPTEGDEWEWVCQDDDWVFPGGDASVDAAVKAHGAHVAEAIRQAGAR